MLKSHLRVIWALGMSYLLASCAAVPYQAPTSGATATVIVRQTTSFGISHLYTYGDLKSCSSLQRIIGNVPKIPDDFSITVKAGESVGFQYNNVLGNRFCAVAMQFDPKVGGKYVLSVRSDTVGCAVGIFDASSGDLVIEPSRKRLIKSSSGLSCNAVPMPATSTTTESGGGVTSPNNGGVTLDDLKGLK
jgi:hypothetical protein